MPSEIILPQLGMMQTEALLVEWLRAEGDEVRAGEAVAVIQTDKADVEIEAPVDGKLTALALDPGQSAQVGTVIAYVLAHGESAPSARTREAAPLPSQGSDEATAPDDRAADELVADEPATAAGSVSPVEVKASPSARRRARELKVDLASVVGTGPEGRITEEDIRAASRAPAATAETVARVRRITAERMTASFQTAPHLYLEAAADATRVLSSASDGITVTDVILHATATVLRAHPALNATYRDDNVIAHERIAIGVAIDTPSGLHVPIIVDPDKFDLRGLGAHRAAMVERARAGAPSQADIGDATFTVTNLGVFGIDAAWPILNPPGVAILAVGRAKTVPVAVDDAIVARPQMRLVVTADHRALDGAEAARFLSALVAELEGAEAA